MAGRPPQRVVLLAGGVGGARIAAGLQALLGDGLAVVVNTGDDLEQHGLLISPDHDTVMYTLAGLEHREQGWGLAGESFANAAMLDHYGEATWFRLGDRDLATHLVRTRRARRGDRPTDIARDLQRALGLRAQVLPMTDAAVRTLVLTPDGWLDFQEYFVRLRQTPEVLDVRFAGIEAATATPEVLAAFEAADTVVIGPSNPFVSIQPILAVAGIEAALQTARTRGAPVVAVSGILGGRAIKGPADRMLRSLGHEASALGVARQYTGIADVFVLDRVDEALAADVRALGMTAIVADTVMADDAGRERVAHVVVEAAAAARP